MSRLLTFIFSTSGFAIGILGAAVAVWRRPGSPTARRFLIGVALFYAIAATYAVPAAIGSWLAGGYHQFQRDDAPVGTTAVVLLGGGAEHVFTWTSRPLPIPNPVGAVRVVEAARVFRMLGPAWLIVSGGVETSDEPDAATMMMRDALATMGVPPHAMKLESQSRDTHEEAVSIAAMLRELGVQHVVLVTSDIHMWRSIGAFRAQGWNAIPAIAPDPRLALPRLQWWVPTDNGLAFSAEVVHELAGIPYYRARGWMK